MAVDHKDNIFVSDMAGHKIIKLDKTSQFLCEWRMGGWPLGLEVAGDILLVAQWEPDHIMAYNLQGGETKHVLS